MLVPPLTPWFAIDGALFGLCIGSFANLALYRLPIMFGSKPPSWREFNLSKPRSCCPRCNAPIKARDNIPVVSYLFLKGRCRRCAWAIPYRYPAVEAGMAVTWAAVAYAAGLSFLLPLGLAGATIVTLSFRAICLRIWAQKNPPI